MKAQALYKLSLALRVEVYEEEVRAFLAGKNKRDELLFCFGIYTGLRISDILTVKVQDVYGKDYFYIVEQKTKKAKQRSWKYTVRKRIPLIKKLQKLIISYCDNLKQTEYLFKSRQGKTDRLLVYVHITFCERLPIIAT